jgi:hypothetical protein
MSDVGRPPFRLSIFCGACALFATGYGYLLLEPSLPMTFLLAWGPVIGVTMWLTANSKRTRAVRAYDSGLLFYLTWPLTLPWYVLRTRGRAGWRLAAKLYGLAISDMLGFVLGAVVRVVVDVITEAAA